MENMNNVNLTNEALLNNADQREWTLNCVRQGDSYTLRKSHIWTKLNPDGFKTVCGVYMTVNQVADFFGVNKDSIKFYTRVEQNGKPNERRQELVNAGILSLTNEECKKLLENFVGSATPHETLDNDMTSSWKPNSRGAFFQNSKHCSMTTKQVAEFFGVDRKIATYFLKEETHGSKNEKRDELIEAGALIGMSHADIKEMKENFVSIVDGHENPIPNDVTSTYRFNSQGETLWSLKAVVKLGMFMDRTNSAKLFRDLIIDELKSGVKSLSNEECKKLVENFMGTVSSHETLDNDMTSSWSIHSRGAFFQNSKHCSMTTKQVAEFFGVDRKIATYFLKEETHGSKNEKRDELIEAGVLTKKSHAEIMEMKENFVVSATDHENSIPNDVSSTYKFHSGGETLWSLRAVVKLGMFMDRTNSAKLFRDLIIDELKSGVITLSNEECKNLVENFMGTVSSHETLDNDMTSSWSIHSRGAFFQNSKHCSMTTKQVAEFFGCERKAINFFLNKEVNGSENEKRNELLEAGVLVGKSHAELMEMKENFMACSTGHEKSLENDTSSTYKFHSQGETLWHLRAITKLGMFMTKTDSAKLFRDLIIDELKSGVKFEEAYNNVLDGYLNQMLLSAQKAELFDPAILGKVMESVSDTSLICYKNDITRTIDSLNNIYSEYMNLLQGINMITQRFQYTQVKSVIELLMISLNELQQVIIELDSVRLKANTAKELYNRTEILSSHSLAR